MLAGANQRLQILTNAKDDLTIEKKKCGFAIHTKDALNFRQRISDTLSNLHREFSQKAWNNKMHWWLTILIHQGVGLLYLSDDFDEFGTGIFALGIIFRTNYDQTTLNKWARPGKCPSRPSSLSLPQHEFHSWQAAKCYKNIKHFALKWIRPNKPLGKTSFHSQMIKVTQAGRAWK